MSKVKCLRLATGEVVIGFYKKLWNGDVQLTDVKQCLVQVAEGKMEVDLGDYLPFAKEYTFVFSKNQILNVFDAKPQLEQNYKISTGNNIRGQRGK
jgi:hypothetical protein